MKRSFFIVLCITKLIVFCFYIYCHDKLLAKNFETEIQIPKNNIHLTDSEKKWIKNNPKVKIAGPIFFPPFHYYNKKGNPEGISADYINSILYSLGIEPLIDKNNSWSEVLEKAQNKKIDLIPCIAKTPKRESYLIFSRPYLSFPICIITRKNSSFIGGIKDLNSKTIAFVRNISTIDWLKKNNIDFTPYYVNTPLEGLKAVSFGKADAKIENLAAFSYFIEKYGLTNLKIAAPTPFKEYSLYMAVRKDLHILNQIINKTIIAIDPEQHTHIRNKWLSVRYEYGINITQVIILISIIILLSAISLILFYIWNRKLKKEISERERAEQALRESEKRLKTAGNATYDLIYEWDVGSDSLKWFGNIDHFLGFEDGEISRDINAWLNLIHPEDKPQLANAVELHRKLTRPIQYEYRIKNSKGEYRYWKDHGLPLLDDNGKPYLWIGVCSDKTEKIIAENERKRLEEQLQQSQKIEAIGTLAGGIAHDFNNMLGIILGNVSEALSSITEKEELYQILLDIQEGGIQAQSLTQQLLTFSKGGAPIKQLTDINQLIEESVGFVIRGSKSNCEFMLSENLPHAMVDPGQLNQSINNIVINAIQAMPEGGTLRIISKEMTLTNKTSLPILSGNYIKISIIDQGSGIPDKDLSRIFDPFYTTKTKGNGLGLSTTFSIIKRHNGHISAESVLGKGTTFHIYLPASKEKALQITKTSIQSVSNNQINGRILIMDDQKPILKMMSRMLNRLGYDTDCAIDGAQAFDIYKKAIQENNPFDFVILDLTIPGGMGGAEAIKKLRELDSNVKAVVSSGYSNDPIMSNYKEYGFCGLIPKPYTKDQMKNLIDSISKKANLNC